METGALLKRLGFAEYEARAYVALLQRSPLNGYELAKLSGVPRADIYSVLQRLEERGAVLRLEAAGGTRYSPAPPDEVIGRLQRSFLETAEQARLSLEQIGAPADLGQVWNVEGREPLVDHARSLIASARRSLLLALGPEESAEVGDLIKAAQERGVEVTTLCTRACPIPCGHCGGDLHRHHLAPESSDNWLIVVRDGEEAVAGLIRSPDEAAGIRTSQALLVDLASWQLRHEIALAALLEDIGPRLDGLLREDTRVILGSMGPGSGGWLEHMRSVADLAPGKVRAARQG